MKNLATSIFGLGDLLLTVHNQSPPTQSEWNEYVSYVRSVFERRGERSVYILSYTLGGIPNAEQRRLLVEATPLASRGKVAVVTGAQRARLATMVLSSTHRPTYRLFGPEQLVDALAWLGIRLDSKRQIQRELMELLREVTEPGSASVSHSLTIPHMTPRLETTGPRRRPEVSIDVVDIRGTRVRCWLHTALDPSRAEWDEAFRFMSRTTVGSRPTANLVLSDGGGPGIRERTIIQRRMDGPLAMVAPPGLNQLKRGITTAVTWLKPDAAFWEANHFDAALDHLGLGGQLDAIWPTLTRLQSQMRRVRALSAVADATREAQG